MRTTALAVGMLLLATTVGCAGNQQQASVDADGSYAPPASIYSVMDSTSLVYTDVAAGAYDLPAGGDHDGVAAGDAHPMFLHPLP